jgi:PAS domain S-box-containing protein
MSEPDLEALSRELPPPEMDSLPAARDERERLRRLFDEAPVAWVTLDCRGTVQMANRAAAALLEYDQTRMIGKPFFVAARMQDAAYYWRHLHRCMVASGSSVSTEIELVRRNGDKRAVSMISSTVPDPSVGFLISTALIDIQERVHIERDVKRAHEEERRARARLEAQVRAGAAIGEAHAEMHVQGVESVLQAIAEQARHLVDGELGAVGIGGASGQPFDHWMECGIGSDDAHAPRRAGALERVASGVIVRTSDLAAGEAEVAGVAATECLPVESFLGVPVRHRDRAMGGLYVVNKRTASDFDRDDERALVLLAEYAAVVIDAALATDEAVRERARLRSILDQLPEAVIVADTTSRLTPNAHALTLGIDSGGRVDPAGNPTRWDVRFPDGQPVPWHELPLVRAFREGKPSHNVELAVSTREGRLVPVLVDATPLVDDEGESLGAVVVWREVEQLKHIEQLRQEWSAVVAHDLRQPLATIRMWDQMLAQSRDAHDAQALRAVAAIEKAVRRMSDMLDDLVDTSLVETHRVTLQKATIDVGELVREVVHSQSTADHRARLVVAPELLPVEADRGRIERVLENLLSNAFKYGTSGSEVEVIVTRRGREAEVAVTNDGETLSADDVRKLFSRFYRAPSARNERGLGLGLYIAQGFIQAHGGRLWCDLGDGCTTFRFTLPCVEPPQAARHDQPNA